MDGADFLPSASNRAACLLAFEGPGAWGGPAAVLVGPEGAGKTHLLNVWSVARGVPLLGVDDLDAESEADTARSFALDDAERVAGTPDRERALFHLYNRLAGTGSAILLASRVPPARWPLGLPDLASRLRTAPVAVIESPDDALRERLLAKLLHDRALHVEEGVLSRLLVHTERSCAALKALVEALDRHALAHQRRALSHALVSPVLAELEASREPRML